MSEDLANEIEAINSIYSENTITSNTDALIYILAIPNHDVLLRVKFPADYPASPPLIEGTETVGSDTRKGDGQSIVNHARETLRQIYTPGQVCLFDLLEELPSRLISMRKEPEAVGSQQEGGDTGGDAEEAEEEEASERINQRRSIPTAPQLPSSASASEPQWHFSPPTTVKKSLFVARATRTHSPAHATACIEQLLASDKRAAKATHNISAYRIRSITNNFHPPTVVPPTTAKREVEGPNEIPGIVYQDFDDDGETAAGGRLLRQMQMMGVWDVLVVVSRWYGGVKLGPARFGIICGVAREALVEGVGRLVEERESEDGIGCEGGRRSGIDVRGGEFCVVGWRLARKRGAS